MWPLCNRLGQEISRGGLSVVPLSIYFNDRGKANGEKLSLKGHLKDVHYRHLGQAHLLMADWQVAAFGPEQLKEASSWLPPKVVWDPES